jgi:hypothetical protein
MDILNLGPRLGIVLKYRSNFTSDFETATHTKQDEDQENVGETILGTVMQKSYLIHEKQDKYVCL